MVSWVQVHDNLTRRRETLSSAFLFVMTPMRKADYADDSQMKAPLVPVTLAFLSGILLGTSVRLPLISLIVVGTVSAGVSLWR